MMKKPIVLAVAPVAHHLPDGCECGLSAQDIARDVCACARAGAAMVHLHVRDQAGYLSEDLHTYDDTVRRIRAQSDIVIQGSTGGESTLTRAQRCVAVRHPLTEAASLNIGSINFHEGAYINTIMDICYWAECMRENWVTPEMEVFDLSMVGTARRLLLEKRVPTPWLTLAVGFPNALEATKHHIDVLFEEFRTIPDVVMGLTQHAMQDFDLFRYAIECGADVVRVGFEDGYTLENGRTAASNLELVENAAAIIRGMGHELADAAYARQLFGIQKGEKA